MTQKLLVLGGSGLVGSRVIELLQSDFEIIAPSSSELDLTKAGNFEKYLLQMQDSGQAGMTNNNITVINFVAFTDVDGAEEETGNEEGLVYRLNAQLPGEIAAFCQEVDMRFIHISTDYVFDGTKEDSAYVEEDTTNPLGWYGKTKLFGEQFVLENGGRSIVLRIEMPYGSRSEKKNDIATILLERLKNGQPIQAINDAHISPVFIDDLAEVIKGVIENKEIEGLYHVATVDSITLYDFVKLIADKAGLSTENLSEITFDEYWKERVANGAAKRPKNSWLDSSKLYSDLGISKKSIEKNIEVWLLFVSGEKL